jgi:2-polyprenyl-6-hydroxyphenyl methylase/3-demethylubiquinone-9 3-methyltransferase
MNPIRHDFIASCLADSTPAPVPTAQAQAKQQQQRGLKYLDVGCGGGIFAESLARTIPLDSNSPSSTALSNQTHASSLLAIDPSPDMIELALQHARKDPTLHSHLQTGKFGYANTTLEDIASSSSSSSSPSPSFDVVTLFEVLEHVDPHTSSPRAFVEQCLRLVAPGGWLIGSTIARTWPSYVINQVIAEAPWPIGVVPPGTHEWSKFVNPDELKGWAEDALVRDESRTKSTTVREAREGAAAGGGGGAEPLRGEPVSKAYTRATWKCVGTVYAPGLGWKLVPGSESWGNYFWGIQKLE